MYLAVILLIVVLLYFFYRWAVKNNDVFEKRGIPYNKPFPFLGSMKDVMLRKKAMFDVVIDLYNMHNGKIYGIFEQRNPLFMIRDPEVIKQITIKDFDHFVNHSSLFGDSDDEGNLFANSLFSMKDNKWKDMRSTLSPVFTGSKMRQMFQLMNQVAQDSLTYMKEKYTAERNEGLEMEMKEFCTRYTNDIIASTAFGLQVNSFTDENNEFYRMGKKVTKFSAWQIMKLFLFGYFKQIMKWLKMKMFDQKDIDYFMNLVLDTMKYRKEHNISRPDMINMLMEARGMIKSDSPKTHNRDWTDTEIVAQCFVFFFAGFETTALLMCFAAHELMENPETQEKLFEEVQDVLQDLDGKPLTYEALQSMKYMDMVTSETLRKWPAAVATDRYCNKDFTYKTSDGELIEIKKDDRIWIPVVGLQRDPKYFENPVKFDPERFSDENKDKIQPFTYLPFGVGPRNCIGLRFALLEAKVILFYMVANFRLEAAKQTTLPMKLATNGFQLGPSNGFWLKLISRNQ